MGLVSDREAADLLHELRDGVEKARKGDGVGEGILSRIAVTNELDVSGLDWQPLSGTPGNTQDTSAETDNINVMKGKV